jgi:hypothetical protein
VADALASATGEATRRRRKLDRTKIAEIVAGLAALPVLDDRSADEILGYGPDGLPA